MDKLPREILGLPIKSVIIGQTDFYFEIQETAGGVGSSKRVHYTLLASAIIAGLAPLQHSSLTDLGADDHPQYLNEVRGDARYTPIAHVTAPDPHPQYQTAVEVDGQIDAKITTLKGEVDPFPIYETSAEAQTKVDAKMAAHLAAADPHPQYETSAEAQAKVDASMSAHLAHLDPHPQYASNAELSAEVAAAVDPIAEQKVADYIASDGGVLIQQEVTAQVPPAVNQAIADHEAAPNPHPQYVLNSYKRNVVTVAPVTGVVTLDLALAENFIVNLTANVTGITITNPPAGMAEIDIDFVQDATGGRTVALPASFVALGGSDTAVDAAANKVTVLVAKTKNGGTTWRYAMQESA